MKAVITAILLTINVVTVFVLVAFTVRRLAYAVALIFDRPKAAFPPAQSPPEILVLVPCQNEETVAVGIIQALARQDYPTERFTVVAIDDASTDKTNSVLRSTIEERENFHLLERRAEDGGSGKPAALNQALLQYPDGEIVCVFDADSRPAPDTLSRAAAHFTDGRVAGVNGRMRAANPDDSPVAYYTYIEGLVHQLVTMRAASRLGATTALMGTNMYIRREVLDELGGFAPGALLEDTDLTLKIPPVQGRVLFDPAIECEIEVPVSLSAYRRQHAGWQRGFAQSLTANLGQILLDPGRSLIQRADALLFSAGYLDRIFLVAAVFLMVLKPYWPLLFFPWWLLAVILISPALQVLLVLAIEKAPLLHYLKLPLLGLIFPFDIAAAFSATALSLLGRPAKWYKTPRREQKLGSSMIDAEKPHPTLAHDLITEGKLLIFILGYNDRGHLPLCFDALFSDGIAPEGLVYIDNCSTDESTVFVHQRWPGIKIIKQDKNLGYAGGMNVALRLAQEQELKYALLLNTDAILEPGAVNALVAEAESDRQVSAVGGLARSGRPQQIDGAFGEVNYRIFLSRLVGEFASAGQLPQRAQVPGDVDYPYGCMWLVSMDAVNEVGLLDEDYFCYHEELEWCYRARRAGYRCRYTPRAVCHHTRYRGQQDQELFKRRMLARNTIRFMKQHAALRHWTVFLGSCLTELPARLIKDCLRGRPDMAHAMLAGYWQGINGR